MGRRRRRAVVRVPWENPPADSPAYPTRGGVVPEGESRVPLQSEPSPPARSRDPWGGFLSRVSGGAAQPRTVGREGPHADPPWKLPDRTDSPRCGSPSWSGGRDSMGCLGEARGLIGGALSSLPAGRPPARGTPIPQGRREGEESPADAADRPRPESAAPGGSTGDDQPVGARTTVKPVKPCPHIHAHPPPCPQSPLTARVQLRDG